MASLKEDVKLLKEVTLLPRDFTILQPPVEWTDKHGNDAISILAFNILKLQEQMHELMHKEKM